ncbi:hypothetical protein CMV_022004 [Castanea mollissima]|uniref:Uncharacterized protein n=1 Tax=Castanea mollissima TaxID=60419 RepID=A0A8J4QVF7_9ROSI|nr:hypothetical protein CMV_022004 [Castanea mollissima]
MGWAEQLGQSDSTIGLCMEILLQSPKAQFFSFSKSNPNSRSDQNLLRCVFLARVPIPPIPFSLSLSDRHTHRRCSYVLCKVIPAHGPGIF